VTATGSTMNNQEQNSRLLREGGQAFFGAVTASLSHEINNVMAIIGELSGLLGDLTAGAAPDRPLKPERITSIAGRVTDQVTRGKRLVKRLNRFAHTVDHPVASLELGETMELITTICRRFADLVKAELQADFPDGELVIENSAFGLMQAVHLCIERSLAAAPDGGNRVTASFAATDDGCRITVTSELPPPEDERTTERLAYLDLLMAELGGRADVTPQRFTLFLPRARADRQAIV